jgi:Co/Zn/Cd efflux system component
MSGGTAERRNVSRGLVQAADCTHTGRVSDDSRSLGLALGITAAFLVAEAVGGWLANSLALLADAGHMLADVGSLALALFAARLAQRPPPPAIPRTLRSRSWWPP